MTSKELAKKVSEKMFENNSFSKWLGIELIDIDAGSATLNMKVRAEMLNSFGIMHGGVSYSMADTAMALASNSHGRKCVALDTVMSYPVPVHEVFF